MLIDLGILIILALFAINGFQRGFLILFGRLLILIVSVAVSLLMMGPVSRLLGYLPFLEPLAESINERVIHPLIPVSASISEAVAKLDLPAPIRELIIAKFPDTGSPLLEVWPQLSNTLARYAFWAVTFFVLLLVVSITISTLVSLMTNILDHVPVLGYLNRLSGFGLGAAHGLLIMAIAILIAGFVAPYVPKLGYFLQKSQIVTYFFQLDLISSWVKRFLFAI